MLQEKVPFDKHAVATQIICPNQPVYGLVLLYAEFFGNDITHVISNPIASMEKIYISYFVQKKFSSQQMIAVHQIVAVKEVEIITPGKGRSFVPRSSPFLILLAMIFDSGVG
jgi:hypothetical protein